MPVSASHSFVSSVLTTPSPLPLAAGLDQAQFLDFHLSLARESFLNDLQYPYCYLPPNYLDFLHGNDKGDQDAEIAAEAIEFEGEQPGNGLVPYDEGGKRELRDARNAE